MPVHDDLGIRMKENYEIRARSYLTRRTPVIIRIDGKAFHTFTKGFMKPFDKLLMNSMWDTMKYLCENIQGCVLGYTQSDEISLLLIDYKNLESSAWFDYQVQKVCSVAASMATMRFNSVFGSRQVSISNSIYDNYCKKDVLESTDPEVLEKYEYLIEDLKEYDLYEFGKKEPNKLNKILDKYSEASFTGALFDARCFNIPKEEVTNYFFWRQQDAIRNSVQMVGQANFTQKELEHKSQKDIKEMLKEQKGIDYDSYTPECKYGVCCKRAPEFVSYEQLSNPYVVQDTSWMSWKIDKNIPVFKGEDRGYIDCILKEFEPND